MTGDAQNQPLISSGLDPARAAHYQLGWPQALRWRGYPPWGRQMLVGLVLWAIWSALELFAIQLPPTLRSAGSLLIGLLVLSAACDALITAAERMAARFRWDQYVAATLAEILSTLPELVAIGFVVVVSPVAALTIALVTIYNNAFVFSVYSFFLPKNQYGRYLMPRAVTEAGSQLLIAGAGIGSVIGLVMLVLAVSPVEKNAFAVGDLLMLGGVMLLIFCVYMTVLVRGYASEERQVRAALKLSDEQLEARHCRAYESVSQTSFANIVFVLLLGIGAAVLAGEQISRFAATAIGELNIGPIATAVLLAAFAGMSEYVILWRAHRKGQHRIALANAFGGITQVMFLVLPFTLIAIGSYQWFAGPVDGILPLVFSHSSILLFGLLFPTFFVLLELIQEDHTFGALDTVIMVVIVLLIITILLTYGS